ncbi:MAG: 4a-hydroxytetrahydrobiopterin dehydratase [Hyphomonadaceae bacterium]|nr:4a-hydroxytetrahydrobiopterin dehydratase [Hyphomonadaceae bacterium]
MAKTLGAGDFLAARPGWARAEEEREAVAKRFKFADFKTAWAFMSASALKAEQMDHHPEWFNVYSTVDVVLTTHDAGGVTEKDAELADFMDALAEKL